MNGPTGMTDRRYRFADLTLDVGQRRVRRGNDAIALSKLSFELLRVLVEDAPNAVQHERLATEAWGPRRVVTPENLAKRVGLLRQALGDHAERSRYIEGIRGHGYRLIPAVQAMGPEAEEGGMLGATEGDGVVAAALASSPPVRRLSRRRLLVGAAAVGVAGLVLDDARLRWARREAALRAGAEPPRAFELSAPPATSFGASPAYPQPDLALGGRELAFVAPFESTDVVWVQTLGSLDARPLRGTEKAAWPFWSADGRSIAFYARGRLKRVTAAGGASATEIASLTGPYWGGTWADDGTVLYGGANGLYRVPAAGGVPVQWSELDASRGEISHRFPVLLPGGRSFVYLALSTQSDREGFYIGSLDDRDAKAWLRPGHSKAAVDLGPDGRLYLMLVGDDGELLAQPFDARRAKLLGDAVEVAPAKAMDISNDARSGALAARDRVLIYRPRVPVRTRLVWRDRTGAPRETLALPEGTYRNPALSHDGTRLVVEREGDGTTSDLWLIDRRRNQNRRLGNGHLSAWTPDDDGVVYSSVRPDGWVLDMKTVGADREGAAQTLLSGRVPFVKRIRDVTRAGLLFHCEVAGESTLYYWPFEGNEPPRELGVVPRGARHARVSPDERWLAFTAVDAGETHVYVTRFPGLGGTVRVSTAQGTDPQWRSDGRELYYVTLDGTLMAVDVTLGDEFTSASPVPLFHVSLDPRSLAFGSAYASSPDGQRFIVAEVVDRAEPRLRVTQRWQSRI